jgi:hypothetical protein
VEAWPYTSPVTATEECKWLRDGMQWHAGREHVRGECLSVCSPTPLMSKAVAAVLIARSEFLGSTAFPLSVVKTRPVSTQTEMVPRVAQPLGLP